MDWLRNRKFMAPIIASFATLLTAIVVGIWPGFPFSDNMVLQLLTWVWTAGLGIPLADALFDQGRNAIEWRQAKG